MNAIHQWSAVASPVSTVMGKWSGPSELLQVIIHGECKGRWRRKNG